MLVYNGMLMGLAPFTSILQPLGASEGAHTEHHTRPTGTRTRTRNQNVVAPLLENGADLDSGWGWGRGVAGA